MDIVNARQQYNRGTSIYDMNLRVVYYARVSTEKDEQLNSLDNQIKFFEDYIKDVKAWTLMGKYIDEGISGTGVKNRTSFLKMIEDGVNGKFDMVITKEVSRFARNTVDSIQYTDYLLKHGVIVDFLNDNLNTIDESCEFRLTMMSSIAQDEVRKLSSRVKFGLKRSVKDGKVLGGGNITGYYKEKGKLYINESEAPMIRMLFDLYSSGKYGYRKIAEILYENGYTNTNGEMIADRVLNRMITNPKYKGYYCGNKSYVEDYKTHRRILLPKNQWIIYKDPNIPAIVSEEIWDEANRIHDLRLKKHENVVGISKHYDKKYRYTGKIYCKEHNVSYSRKCHGHRSTSPVWQCLEYHRHGLKACQTPTLHEKHLDDIFKNIIGRIVESKSSILSTMLEDYKKIMKCERTTDNEKKINNKIDRIKTCKNKLLELSVDGFLSNDEFKKRNDEYNDELELLSLELKNVKDKSKNENEYLNKIKALSAYLNSKLDIDNSFEELFELLVDKVLISKINDDRKHIKMEIEFNFDIKSQCLDINFDKNNKYIIKKDNKMHEYPLCDNNRPRDKCNANSASYSGKCCG